ncbi:para-aminobenzoate synthase PabaA [Talaromyces proteolyticus]|uniref:aminodeoxychorismate synthase n=1 Tax=Talaromyces proteolyticus TaxID=1131652 RepID=A0AAD4PWH0_9EURO|nr:para-aminobenzoate synthase PabaA [Talaromyces proteolyticus]KAH8695080.1 para-aminobenzoate synthase PabaA [Talaromyces proteolyticus]
MENESPLSIGVNAITAKRNILYLDAYDSFTNNVISMLEENLDVQVTILTVDSEWPEGGMLNFLRAFDAIVLGPGPGNPECAADVGIMRDVWSLDKENLLPILGICLGFQSLCLHHGLPIKRLPLPLHGQVHRVSSTNKDIFTGLDDFEVTLYHSLYVSTDAGVVDNGSISDDKSTHLTVSHVDSLSFLAWLSVDKSGPPTRRIPMAVRHRRKPFWGFQFHPESCKSDKNSCTELLKRWWAEATAFNQETSRLIRASTNSPPSNDVSGSNIQKNLENIFEDLTTETTQKCSRRSLSLDDLRAENIFELFNTPGSPSVLFQSNGRYSIMSVQSPQRWRMEYFVPSKVLSIQECGTSTNTKRETGVSTEALWDALRHVMSKRKVFSGREDVPFWGGFLGYFSYEMGLAGLAHPKTSPLLSSDSENVKPEEENKNGVPDVSLLWVERSIVIDNNLRIIHIQSTRELDDAPNEWIDSTYKRISQYISTQNSVPSVKIGSKDVEVERYQFLTSVERELTDKLIAGSTVVTPDEASYKSKIIECQQELEAGESYELCLTGETTITLPTLADENLRKLRPWLIYKKLKTYNPAAFSAYGCLGRVKIASSSPECFLNWDRKSTLEMKPMKGTVRKSPGMTFEKAKEILATTKEMAENLMIADLIRHDLYGICGSGNVHVEKLLEVEDYGRVYSMITHIKGLVRRTSDEEEPNNMAAYGLTTLQRSLPPGSMTGAPKERSCMHLDRIEERKRGLYSGVMGFLDIGGSGSFSVLIRTAFSYSDDEEEGANKPELWHVGAGGAVTILSTPQGEWDEMITKQRTVVNIFGFAM